MTYEIIYTKTTEHTIDIEAESIAHALESFTSFTDSSLEDRERSINPSRKVTAICKEED